MTRLGSLRAAAATAVAALTLIVGGTTTALADPAGATGTLSLNGYLALTSVLGGCPTPSYADFCGARKSSGPFPGLGQTSATYEFYGDYGQPSCEDPNSGSALAYPLTLVVEGKGEVHLAVDKGSECMGLETLYNQTQSFTVTGGTGIYVGASGSGTLERQLGDTTSTGRHGRERWKGTLNVPGLDFDVTSPVISGATSKTVRAKTGARSARVSFTVTAQDDRDGSLRVTCAPRSGFRFPVGKTKVTCEATDSSGNPASSSFTVTVKRTR